MTKLLDRDRWVFHQKTKIIELNIDFEILDEEGAQIGMVRQEGQSQLKKMARLVSSLDQFMTHTLAVYDVDGTKVVELTRPRKVFTSPSWPFGADLGRIVQQNMVGKIRFALAGRRRPGSRLPERGELAGLEPLDRATRRGTRSPGSRKLEGSRDATTADHYMLVEVIGENAPALAPCWHRRPLPRERLN